MKSELSAAALRFIVRVASSVVLNERLPDTHAIRPTHQMVRVYNFTERGEPKSRAFCCTLYVIGKVIFDG